METKEQRAEDNETEGAAEQRIKENPKYGAAEYNELQKHIRRG
jgi:hypothetical protein